MCGLSPSWPWEKHPELLNGASSYQNIAKLYSLTILSHCYEISSLIHADSMESPEWLTVCPNCPLLLAGHLDRIQCLHKIDECKSLLVNQHWYVHVFKSIRKCRLWVHPYFSSDALHVLFILLGGLMKWKPSGSTAAVLWGCCFKNFFKTTCSIFCSSYFFSSLQVLHSSPGGASIHEYRNSDCSKAIPFYFITEIRFSFDWKIINCSLCLS